MTFYAMKDFQVLRRNMTAVKKTTNNSHLWEKAMVGHVRKQINYNVEWSQGEWKYDYAYIYTSSARMYENSTYLACIALFMFTWDFIFIEKIAYPALT